MYPWIKGGAEKRIYEIGKRLAKNGDDVHLFGIKWWDGKDVIKYEGMTLHGVCAARELYVNGRRSISEALVFSLKLLPHLLRGKFDVIDVSVFPYFSCLTVKYVSVLRRTPMVLTWHEVWGNYWYEYMGRAGIFGKVIELVVSKLSTNVVAVSDMTKRDLESLGVDGRNIHVIRNGVSLKRISGMSQSDEECDIIFVGRLIREKNVDVLLEAVALVRKDVPDVKCFVIGSGNEKGRLVDLAASRGLQDNGNVKFFKFMEYDEVIARIKSSKTMVLPSSREGFGIVVLEAFACGVPVVTVNETRNAAAELVNETRGFVVELNAQAIAGAVQTLLADDGLYERMSVGAKKTAHGYDWNSIDIQLRKVYGELI